jgi:hypothetical protein
MRGRNSVDALSATLLAVAAFTIWSAVAPAIAQTTCSTNFCVRSQAAAVQVPPGWPAVSVDSCCRTRWGALPDGMDWASGIPIMLCTGNANYENEYPNCGATITPSQDFPLSYDNPKIGIGVAWPNSKNYRYQVESIPIVDGSDGTCARFANTSGKPSSWWVYDLMESTRGTYLFTAALTFRQGEKGYYAVLDNCRLTPPNAPGNAK